MQVISTEMQGDRRHRIALKFEDEGVYSSVATMSSQTTSQVLVVK